MKFTEAALDELRKLKPEGKILRVSILGAGCSGLSYKLSWEDKNSDSLDPIGVYSDFEFTMDGKSTLFLAFVTVDYSSGLNGKGFTFDNTQAKRVCGCGSSFS